MKNHISLLTFVAVPGVRDGVVGLADADAAVQVAVGALADVAVARVVAGDAFQEGD